MEERLGTHVAVHINDAVTSQTRVMIFTMLGVDHHGHRPLSALRELSGAERDEWRARVVAAYPPYAEYQTRTERQIPVFVVTLHQ